MLNPTSAHWPKMPLHPWRCQPVSRTIGKYVYWCAMTALTYGTLTMLLLPLIDQPEDRRWEGTDGRVTCEHRAILSNRKLPFVRITGGSDRSFDQSLQKDRCLAVCDTRQVCVWACKRIGVARGTGGGGKRANQAKQQRTGKNSPLSQKAGNRQLEPTRRWNGGLEVKGERVVDAAW